MNTTAPEQAQRAIETLERAFTERDNFRTNVDRPAVGIVGNFFPEVLVAAAGGLPVHLALGATNARSSIDEVVEPFVDAEVRTFLTRLIEGEFADCRGIIFSRDDAPALVAYQYATEWVRQGKAKTTVPPLFLWNLVHTATPAVERFNNVQAEKLFDFLAGIGLERPTPSTISDASVAETERREGLDHLQANVGSAVAGSTAMRWRNAGRFMTAAEHAQLLNAALPVVSEKAAGTRRLGIVGSPLECEQTYALFETFGTVVADIQPWGTDWPALGNTGATLEEILRLTAADPACPRITPTSAHRVAIVEALVAARCDLVICQLAQTDDTFGWEIPQLAKDLADKGIAFINLGFRDPEPDASWLAQAKAGISAALESHK